MRLRSPPFDSLAVNSYEAGEGIRSHVDLLRFEDGIAIVSLLSAVSMDFHFTPAERWPLAAAPEVPAGPERDAQPQPHSAQRAHDVQAGNAQTLHAAASDACGHSSQPGGCAAASPVLSAPLVACPGRGAEQQIGALARCPDQLVRLEPGDVLTLHGAARYEWSHGIQFVPADLWQGEALQRSHRISLTFRTLSRTDDVLKQ